MLPAAPPRIPFETGAGLWWYEPIQPQADTDELAKSPRLILYHDRRNGPRLSVYPGNGEMQAGWVVGVGESQKKGA